MYNEGDWHPSREWLPKLDWAAARYGLTKAEETNKGA
jgi:hypothetical protein